MFVKRCARERSFFLNLLVTRALIGIFIKYNQLYKHTLLSNISIRTQNLS